MNLRTAVTLLPTPSATNSHDNEVNGRGEVLLPGAVKLLATPRATDGEKGGPNQCNSRGSYDALPGQVAPQRFGKYQAAVERWEIVLGRPAPAPTVPTGRGGAHRLNPAFAAWMMGLDNIGLCNEGNGLSRNDQLKAVGNACCPQQAKAAIGGLLDRAKANGFKQFWEE